MLTRFAETLEPLKTQASQVERAIIRLFDAEAVFKSLMQHHDQRERYILYPTLDQVTNWKYKGPRVRFHVPVGVAYGSDVRQVEKLLLAVARQNADVLSEPPPKVWFRGFGDYSLQFELLVWNTSLVHRKGQFIGD